MASTTGRRSLFIHSSSLSSRWDFVTAGNRADRSHSHRTKNIDPEIRKQRLESYIVPVKQGWSDPNLTEALRSFQGFCQLLGLDKVQEYLISRRVHEIPDFSNHPLDTEGQALQNELTEKFKVWLHHHVFKNSWCAYNDRHFRSALQRHSSLYPRRN